MERLYGKLLQAHLKSDEEMFFLSGPRQVGKTTLSQHAATYTNQYTYLNWDDEDHRAIILQGPRVISQYARLDTLQTEKAIVAFDEIHKHPDWKNFLKGFYYSYKAQVHILVTGSARLDIYKRGGDSLMGRYFSYRMHPISVAECIRQELLGGEIAPPQKISVADYQALIQFGGFPKPFLRRDPEFYGRWKNLRKQQLFREDIRDISTVHNIAQLELLAELLQARASLSLTYSQLAKYVRVSTDTIKRWFDILESFYYCYRIYPWSKNISRSLIKEPKVYLWDWALVSDVGAKAENFIASHLRKATDYWTDRGLGEFDVYYIRTLEKRKVDFIVTKNSVPWFLVEVKNSANHGISPQLKYFQEKTGAEHALQVVLDMPYVDKDCFSIDKPMIVPAITFLSQLV